MLTKLRGWVRLFLFNNCPHCNSDGCDPCPICDGGMPERRGERRKIWAEYKKLLSSIRKK